MTEEAARERKEQTHVHFRAMSFELPKRCQAPNCRQRPTDFVLSLVTSSDGEEPKTSWLCVCREHRQAAVEAAGEELQESIEAMRADGFVMTEEQRDTP